MTYIFTREELDTILELCAGHQSKVGDRYQKHVEMALKELTDIIKPMIHEKLDLDSDMDQKGHVHPSIRFHDRVEGIVAKERAEERAKQEIKSVKLTFNYIREMLKQAEEAMGQDNDTDNAWKSLDQVKQIIGAKRKADEDEDNDESDDLVEMDQPPAPKRQA